MHACCLLFICLFSTFLSASSIICNCRGKHCSGAVKCVGTHCIIEQYLSTEMYVAKCGYDSIENDNCSASTSDHQLDYKIFLKIGSFGLPPIRVCRCKSDFCNTANLFNDLDKLSSIAPTPVIQDDLYWKLHSELINVEIKLEEIRAAGATTNNILHSVLVFVMASFILTVLWVFCVSKCCKIRAKKTPSSLLPPRYNESVPRRTLRTSALPDQFSDNPPSYISVIS